MSELIDEIFRVFREYGSGQYLGEPVSMTRGSISPKERSP